MANAPITNQRTRPEARLTAILLILFFCSGACALIYQVLWLRLLGLIFGVTVLAATTVWASFMAGLAIGSVAGGRLGDRTSRPLVWFGTVEILVGVTALISPFVFEHLRNLYVTLNASLLRDPTAALVARSGMAFGVLVVPTLLMGATLPLVVRSALFRTGRVRLKADTVEEMRPDTTQDDLGGKIGLLYGTNTAGAIAGTLAAGLYLIPTLGIRETFWLAASLNVVSGLVAIAASFLTLARPGFTTGGARLPVPSARPSSGPVLGDGLPSIGPVLSEDRPSTSSGRTESIGRADAASPLARRLVLLVFFVSGFASLALEVIWFRVIILIVRPTVYGFSVMLATVLLGISLGSYLVAFWMRRRIDWLPALAIVEILIGFTALFSLGTLNQVPALNAAIEPLVARALPPYLAYSIAASVPALLPTTILLGVAFPIGLRLWSAGGKPGATNTASRVGLFYALNVCGGILGSLAAGFFLLPQLGSRNSLIGIAALQAASGAALLMASGVRPMWRVVPSGMAALLFGFAASSLNDPFDAFLAVRYPRDQLLWRQESPQSTVSVHRQRDGALGLFVEGNHQASDGRAMVSTHRRIGHLPLVVHPDPRQALVVGLGGGATAGAASLHDGVDITVVELSAAVVQAAAYFEQINHGLLRRPNVRISVNDGRNHLLLARGRYDVVTADIILPIHAGSNNLYSAEYFELVRHALKPGGIALQWVWGTATEYKLIMRTFLSVFPHTTLWGDGSLMIGSEQPLRLRRSDFDWKREIPGRRIALAELGTSSFDDLLKQYVAGSDELRRYVGPGPVLTDDLPLVEYFLSLPPDREVDLEGLKGDVREIVADSEVEQVQSSK